MSAAFRVLRDGTVLRGDRLLGYVDRWDHRSRPPARPLRSWRWVMPGGQVSPVRFGTRGEAVQALLAEAGVSA